jgi:hypothetical protein
MLTDGSFIACYPLNNLLKIKIHARLIAGDLIKTFRDHLSSFEDIGIYPWCTSCPIFGTRCNGGCLSYRIRRYSDHPYAAGVPCTTPETGYTVKE